MAASTAPLNILILGYYGFGNLGDELILKMLIGQLRRRYNSPQLTVISSAVLATQRVHGITAISRKNLFSILLAFFKTDLFVLGGGGLLQDKTSARSLLYYLGNAAFAMLLNIPVFGYALGVEGIRRPYLRKLTGLVFGNPLAHISVRDKESREQLARMGVPERKIILGNDPVFGLAPVQTAVSRYGADISMAVFVPRSGLSRIPEMTCDRVIAGVQRRKIRIQMYLFEPHAERAQALKLGHYLTDEFRMDGPASLDRALQTLASAQIVVSARFHGLVLAYLAGKPCLGVGDFEKVGRLCARLKMPYIPWGAEDSLIDEAIQKLLESSPPHPTEKATVWEEEFTFL